MRKSIFLKHISSLEEEDLKVELETLYDKLEEVKTFYKMELGTAKDKNLVLKKAKKDILSKFATKSFRKPRRPRIQKINTILRDLKKQVLFEHDMIDMYLFTVETAIDFSQDYRFYSEVLERNINRNFTTAIDTIISSFMKDEYSDRCVSLKSKLGSYSLHHIHFQKELNRLEAS